MIESLTICDITTVLILEKVQLTIILTIIIAIIGIFVFTCKEIIHEIIQEWFRQKNEKSKVKQHIFEVPTSDIPEFHDYLENIKLEKYYSTSNILKHTDPLKYHQYYFQWLRDTKKE